MTRNKVFNETNTLKVEQTSIFPNGIDYNFHTTSSWKINLCIGLRQSRVEGGPGGIATGRALRRYLAKLERKAAK